MALKVVVANKILTRVKGVITDENGTEAPFNFQLEQDRVSQAELEATIANKSESASAFIKRTTHGWRDQRLVLDDDKPASFSAEALDALLSIAGMAGHCWQAYLTQVLAHEKN